MTYNRSPDEIEHDLDETRTRLDTTLDALQGRLSPGDMLDRTMYQIRSNGGGFARNFTSAVRENPVPMAMLGVGLAWLMMNERNSQGYRTDAVIYPDEADIAYEEEGGTDWKERAKRGVARTGEAAGSARSAASSAVGTARSVVGSAASGLRSGASSTASGVGRSLSAARHTAGSMTSSATEGVGSAGRGLMSAASTAGSSAASGVRAAGHGLSSAGRASTDFYESHPLTAGALALAAGALLAATLPRTRREDEMFQPIRDKAYDEVRHRANAAATEAAHRARAATEAAAHPESVGEQAGQSFEGGSVEEQRAREEHAAGAALAAQRSSGRSGNGEHRHDA